MPSPTAAKATWQSGFCTSKFKLKSRKASEGLTFAISVKKKSSLTKEKAIMDLTLSKSEITSAVGAVLPLHLGFDSEDHESLAKAPIKWSVDADILALRAFSGEDKKSFNNGVLLILKRAGKATVTAELDGKVYTCSVTVNERKTYDSADTFNYYVGDLHDHTGNYHDREKFAERTSGFQDVYLNCVKKEGLMDFGVISDHAVVVNDTDFFRGFTEYEKAQPMCAVIFPGAESEITYTEVDRFGILRRKSGEIVTFNSAGYAYAESFDEFTDAFEASPSPVGIFAHPQTVGFSTKGIWDFAYHKNNTDKMLRIIRGVEMGDGSLRKENLIHELSYSVALDQGFKVSTTCSSDSHGSKWGYAKFPGKTVVMAKEKSREAFIDAFRNNRFYATESGNLKIRYSVNGRFAPCTLPECDTYDFHVELSYFREDDTTKPTFMRVISDGGRCVLELKDIDPAGLDFTVKSDTASYFYLRFYDSYGRRSWSVPVFCGRICAERVEKKLSPMAYPVGTTAIDTVSGKDAAQVIDGSPYTTYTADRANASILIDLKGEVTFDGVGYLPKPVEFDGKRVGPDPWRSTDHTAKMPAEFEIYASCDGENFEKLTDGVFRTIGGENLIPTKKTTARYVRVDIKNNLGELLNPVHYGGECTELCNFTLFENI